MAMWINSLGQGMIMGSAYVILLAIPYIILSMAITKKINIAKYIVNGLFLFYMCCLFAVVFLPLPTIDSLPTEYVCQLIPGYALYDIAKNPGLEPIAQVLFNIALTVPFGAYIKYYFKKDMNVVIVLTVLLTTFIEVGQLTGLFFIYNGSYRLFDVDDLILNTLGGFLGAYGVSKLTFLPSLDHFDLSLARLAHKHA